MALSLDVGCGGEKRGDIGLDINRCPATDVVGDAHNLPFKSKTFDFCSAYSVLEHVAKPKRVLLELRRVLKQGGRLRILVPSDSTLKSDAVAMILTLHFPQLLKQYKTLKSGEHRWQFTEKSLGSMLVSAGFCVERIFRPPSPFISGRRVGSVLSRLGILRFPHLVAEVTVYVPKSDMKVIV